MAHRSTTHPDVVPGLLRRLNVRRVLEAIQQHGPSTRADLTRRTGISPPTVSKLAAQLEAGGLLEMDAEPVMTNGRPGYRFRLATRNAYMLGAVVDVRTSTAVATGLDGVIEAAHVETFRTPKRLDVLIDMLADRLDILRARRAGRCFGLGLTLPGLILRDTGQSVFCPNMHFLNGHNPGELLARRLGVKVVTIQEQHALCLAEQFFGRGRDLTHFLVVDISVGYGMGVFNGGSFLSGAHGFGGEIGHITVVPDGIKCGCGNHGCLETVATDTAVARALAARLGLAPDMDVLIRAAREGRLKNGEDIISGAIDYLAIGVAAAINILNPQAVFVHGRLFDLQPNLFETFLRRLGRRTLAPPREKCSVVRADVDKARGSLAGVLHHIYTQEGPLL